METAFDSFNRIPVTTGSLPVPTDRPCWILVVLVAYSIILRFLWTGGQAGVGRKKVCEESFSNSNCLLLLHAVASAKWWIIQWLNGELVNRKFRHELACSTMGCVVCSCTLIWYVYSYCTSPTSSVRYVSNYSICMFQSSFGGHQFSLH